MKRMAGGRPILNVGLDEGTFEAFHAFCVRNGVTAAALVEAFARHAVTEDLTSPVLLRSLPTLIEEARVIAAERRKRPGARPGV